MMFTTKMDFRKIFSLSDFVKISVREQIGIDLSGNHFRLARVIVRSNRKELVDVVYRDTTGLSDEDISLVVKSVLGAMNIKNPEILIAVPSHLVITKNIEIPSINHQEITTIVNLQAVRHTPYSREEIIVDYIHIGTYKETYSRILLLIAARDVIKRQFMLVEQAGFKCSGVFFAPEAIAAILDQFLKLNSREVPIGSIHIDDTSTDFMIVFKGKPMFIRSIPIGAQHFIEEKD